MKMKLMMFALVSLFSLLTLNASAQDIESVAIANIPFAFYDGHQKMPAGTYRVGLTWVCLKQTCSLADAVESSSSHVKRAALVIGHQTPSE